MSITPMRYFLVIKYVIGCSASTTVTILLSYDAGQKVSLFGGRFFCPYFSGQEKLRIRTVFTQWWATSSCFFFEKLCWKNCKKWLLVQAFDKWWCVEWFFVSHCYNCSSITIREIQESSSSVITVFVTKVVTYMKHWLARYFNNLFRSSSRVIRTKFSIVHSTNAQINETL